MTKKAKTETPLYRKIATALEDNHIKLVDRYASWLNGSGVSNVEISSPSPYNKIVLSFFYDHMDESGSYIGATSYKATITPSLVTDIDVKVTGKYAHIRAYLEDTLIHKLTQKA